MPTATDGESRAALPRRGRWIRLGGLGAGLAAALGLAVAILSPRRAAPEEVYETTLGALEAGRFDDAEAGLARLARLRAPTVLDRGVRARLEIACGRPDQALATLATIPDSHPLAGWAHLRSGQLERARHRLPAAERQLRLALARDPGLIEARRELIYILGLQLRRRELDLAFAALDARSLLTPKEVWVWGMVHDLVWWSPEEHSALLREALRADPDDRWSRLALAEDERRLNHHAEAEAILAPLPSSDPDARAARAGLALERDGPDAAAALLADGPEDHPGLAGLRGRLAIVRRDGSEAVRHLERALHAEPGRRRTLADLGHAWLIAGRADKAQPFLDAGARLDALDNLLLKAERRLDRPDPAHWRQLGAACEAAGRLPEARAWYRLAAAHDPLDDEAQQALFRLQAGGEIEDEPQRHKGTKEDTKKKRKE